MEIFTSPEALTGHTPMLALTQPEDGSARLLAKLELANPTGSVKDRAALAMIRDGERRGLLIPGGVILEATSGNLGISLAAVAAQRGYRAILVMPDTMSRERLALIHTYGGETVLTPGSLGMEGAVQKASDLARELPGCFVPDQFRNPANAAAHRASTGPEIWEDTQGRVDIFVAGVGSGGTITGVGEFLKSKKSRVQVVAVEPAASPLLSQGWTGNHGIQGLGANFVPPVLNTAILDEVFPVTDKEAAAAARELCRTRGILAGISSGAALHAAVQIAKRPKNRGKTVVTLFPDSGERYLSRTY